MPPQKEGYIGKKQKDRQKPAKKQKPKSYTLHELKHAVEEVKAGKFTSWQAGRKYGIPHSTIYGLAKGWTNRPPPPTVGRAMGRPTAMSQETEEEIANCLATMNEWGFSFSRNYLCDFVQSYIKKNNLTTPFPDGRPSWKWFCTFLKRQNLTLNAEKNIASQLLQDKDPFVVYGFYDLLSNHYSEEDVWNKPQCVYNLSETSIRFDSTGSTVVAPVGQSEDRQISEPGKESTTILACVSASGHILPPHIVFPGNTLEESWLDPECKRFPGTTVDCSDHGWMTQDTFKRWFQNVFITEVKVRPCVLIVDGQTSHISIELVEKAIEEKIVILNSPPNTTHILQPLDMAFSKPFKEEWGAIVSKWHRASHEKPMTKHRFLEEIGNFWYTLSSDTCKAEFRKTGIFPYNPSVISPTSFNPDAYQRYMSAQQTQDNINFIKSEIPEDTTPETRMQTPSNVTTLEVGPIIYNEEEAIAEYPCLYSVEEHNIDRLQREVDQNESPKEQVRDIKMEATDEFILPNDLTVPNSALSNKTGIEINKYLPADMSSSLNVHHLSSHRLEVVESLESCRDSGSKQKLCDVSIQTTLTLDPNISDEDMMYLQQMGLYFQRKTTHHVCPPDPNQSTHHHVLSTSVQPGTQVAVSPPKIAANKYPLYSKLQQKT